MMPSMMGFIVAVVVVWLNRVETLIGAESLIGVLVRVKSLVLIGVEALIGILMGVETLGGPLIGIKPSITIGMI